MQYDLVSASYVLSELKNSQERISTIKNLWKTVSLNGVLVLVEPGTPIGYGIIKVFIILLFYFLFILFYFYFLLFLLFLILYYYLIIFL